MDRNGSSLLDDPNAPGHHFRDLLKPLFDGILIRPIFGNGIEPDARRFAGFEPHQDVKHDVRDFALLRFDRACNRFREGDKLVRDSRSIVSKTKPRLQQLCTSVRQSRRLTRVQGNKAPGRNHQTRALRVKHPFLIQYKGLASNPDHSVTRVFVYRSQFDQRLSRVLQRSVKVAFLRNYDPLIEGLFGRLITTIQCVAAKICSEKRALPPSLSVERFHYYSSRYALLASYLLNGDCGTLIIPATRG